MAQEPSVVRLVNEILLEAIESRASDVHIESQQSGLRIRYRIDGVLHPQPMPPEINRFQAAIISRLKIMARLNIAETPPAAGRPHPAEGRRPRGRRPRLGDPHDPRRRASCCACSTRARMEFSLRKLGMERRPVRDLPAS